MNPAAQTFISVLTRDLKARPRQDTSADINAQAATEKVADFVFGTTSIGAAPPEVNKDSDSFQQSHIGEDGRSTYRTQCFFPNNCVDRSCSIISDIDNDADSRLEYDPANPLLSEALAEVPEVNNILAILRNATPAQAVNAPRPDESDDENQEQGPDNVSVGTSSPWRGPLVVSSDLAIKDTAPSATIPEGDLNVLVADAPELVDVGCAVDNRPAPEQHFHNGVIPHHRSFFGQPAAKNSTNTAVSLFVIFGPAKACASKQALEDKFLLRQHVIMLEARKLVDPVAIQGHLPETTSPGHRFIEAVTGMATKLYGQGWWPEDPTYDPYEDDSIVQDDCTEESYTALNIVPANGFHPVPDIPTATEFIYRDYAVYDQWLCARNAKGRARRLGPRLQSKLRQDISEALLSEPSTKTHTSVVKPELVRACNSDWAKALNLEEVLGQSATDLDDTDDCAIVSDDELEAVPVQVANSDWSSSFSLGHLRRPTVSTPALDQVHINSCQALEVYRDPHSTLATPNEASADTAVAIYSPDEAEIASEDAFIYDDAGPSSIEDAPNHELQLVYSELVVQRQAEEDIYEILHANDAVMELVEQRSDNDRDIESEDDYIYGSSGHEVEQTSSSPAAQSVNTMQIIPYKSSADRIAELTHPILPGLDILRAEQEAAQQATVDDASEASSTFISNPVTPQGSPYKRAQSNTPTRMRARLFDAMELLSNSDQDSDGQSCHLSDIPEEPLDDEEEAEQAEDGGNQDTSYSFGAPLSDILEEPEELEDLEDLGEPNDEDSGLYPHFLRMQQAAASLCADSPTVPSLVHGDSSEFNTNEDVELEIAANESFSFFSLSEVWKYIEEDDYDVDDTVIRHNVYRSLRSSDSDISLLDINGAPHKAITLFDTPPPSSHNGEESVLDDATVTMLSFDDSDAEPLDLSFNADVVQHYNDSLISDAQSADEGNRKVSRMSKLRGKLTLPRFGLKRLFRKMIKGRDGKD